MRNQKQYGNWKTGIRYLHGLQRQARKNQHRHEQISPETTSTSYEDVAFSPAMMDVERAGSGTSHLLSVPELVRLWLLSKSLEAIGSQQEESSSYQAIDHRRSIWTSPFTLPSRTIKNTYKNKRNWSMYRCMSNPIYHSINY